MYSKSKWSRFLSNVIEIALLLLVVFLIRTFGFGLYQVPTGSMETTMLVGERFFADKFSYIFRSPRSGEIIAFNEPPQSFTYSKNPLINLYQHYVWGPTNWTKRVIGVSGDLVRGVIEDGKPEVYINDKKLDEPYLNKYPLIHLYRIDSSELEKKIEQKKRELIYGGFDSSFVARIGQRMRREYMASKSYDPNFSFEQQPFYHLSSNRVFLSDGKPVLLHPGIPQPSSNQAALTRAIEQKKNYWDGSDEFYVQLGSDEYWFMGDNRKGSKDCRVFGPIKRKFIHGRILLRIWSIDSDESWWILDLLRHPIDFWKRVRWGRFFQMIY